MCWFVLRHVGFVSLSNREVFSEWGKLLPINFLCLLPTVERQPSILTVDGLSQKYAILIHNRSRNEKALTPVLISALLLQPCFLHLHTCNQKNTTKEKQNSGHISRTTRIA